MVGERSGSIGRSGSDVWPAAHSVDAEDVDAPPVGAEGTDAERADAGGGRP